MVKNARPTRSTKFTLVATKASKAPQQIQQKKQQTTSTAPVVATTNKPAADDSNSLGHAVKKLSKKERKIHNLALKKNQRNMPLAAPGAPCSVKDLINAAIFQNNNHGNNSNNNNNNAGRKNNNTNNNKKNQSNTLSSSSLDPFGDFSSSSNNANSSFQDAAENTNNNTDDLYQSPDHLLQEGNQFFIKRNKEERALTKAAMKKIEEMKRINQKGGDTAGFKFIIPKSAKKLASRMAGDVDITVEDRKTATNSKLLPPQSSVGGTDDSGENINDVGGLNDDDRPMRKKKPREAKELKDFYTFQKWKNWTKNAENFLSRGRLSRKVFDNKRKFRSV